MVSVQLARFRAVMRGMGAMARGAMGMMRRGIGIVFFIVHGGLTVMVRCLFVMLGGGMMMCASGMLVRHEALLVVDGARTHRACEVKMSLVLFCTNFTPRRSENRSGDVPF
jgi:hypothetical protein